MFFRKNLIKSLCAGALLLIGGQMATAGTLDGSTMSAEYRFPDPSTLIIAVASAPVGPGIEFPDFDSAFPGFDFSIDIGGDTIAITTTGSNTFSATQYTAFIFRDVGNSLPDINDVEILANDFDAGAVSFTDDTITLLMTGGGGFGPGESITLQVSTVPLPAAALLMASALGGLGVAARRRRKPAAS